jgi:organic radical activating enzyme
VFCRFSGCNVDRPRKRPRHGHLPVLRHGLRRHRRRRGGKFKTPAELAALIDSAVAGQLSGQQYVVFTGGEPLLQLDTALIDAMHAVGFTIAIETNGTCRCRPADWICVSPKMGSTLVVHKGNEIKVVIRSSSKTWPRTKAWISRISSCRRWMALAAQNMKLAIETCKRNPKWKLSLQTHKLLQIP